MKYAKQQEQEDTYTKVNVSFCVICKNVGNINDTNPRVLTIHANILKLVTQIIKHCCLMHYCLNNLFVSDLLSNKRL